MELLKLTFNQLKFSFKKLTTALYFLWMVIIIILSKNLAMRETS